MLSGVNRIGHGQGTAEQGDSPGGQLDHHTIGIPQPQAKKGQATAVTPGDGLLQGLHPLAVTSREALLQSLQASGPVTGLQRDGSRLAAVGPSGGSHHSHAQGISGGLAA
ncbi:MAG: hypothetical protein ERJ67_07065 [Aphanocapsa feldmannii 277cV]|uniref:Uncharacterized protein n=1 Tax=Aphanocapsa feldmannii 277cV TaxID=2507553 RepID=A0A524RMP4_9CHRO|nr:MAG: hypothetical protein ERJ67_07065 [Aphanocapsa feldmannii 277cV]